MVITATFDSLTDMKKFADFMAGKGGTAHPSAAASPQPAAAQAAPVAPAAFAQAAPMAPAAPAQHPIPAQPAPASAPTADRAYTLDELGNAGVALQEMGKANEIRALVASFGVPSIQELPEAQYGAFATAMRSMGAPI